jgi:hypothetical protein
VLGDAERKKYDELGAAGTGRAAFSRHRVGRGRRVAISAMAVGSGENGGVEFEFGGTGFSDFFEVFRRQSRSAAFADSRPRSEVRRGADVEADIMVTLEVLHGSARPVSLRRAGSNKIENYQVNRAACTRAAHSAGWSGRSRRPGQEKRRLFLRVSWRGIRVSSKERFDSRRKVAPGQAVLGESCWCRRSGAMCV